MNSELIELNMSFDTKEDLIEYISIKSIDLKKNVLKTILKIDDEYKVVYITIDESGHTIVNENKESSKTRLNKKDKKKKKDERRRNKK